LWAQI
jgi:hypothetical protein